MSGTAPPVYVYSLVVRAMLYAGERDDESIWGIEHHFALKTGTLADTVKLLGLVAPDPEVERCQRIDFTLVVYRRLTKHGGRGKRVETRLLASVCSADRGDVLDQCLAIMPWRELEP